MTGKPSIRNWKVNLAVCRARLPRKGGLVIGERPVARKDCETEPSSVPNNERRRTATVAKYKNYDAALLILNEKVRGSTPLGSTIFRDAKSAAP